MPQPEPVAAPAAKPGWLWKKRPVEPAAPAADAASDVPAPAETTPAETTPAETTPAGSPPAEATRAQPVPGEPADPAYPAASEPHTVVITAVPTWLNWAPAAVLGVGALVMAVLLVVFSHGVWWGPDPKQVPQGQGAAVVRDQVLAAAKTCVASANTYKYTDLEDYENKALACTTGEFTNQLRDTIEQFIKANAPTQKASQTAQINRGGIESISPDSRQWTIILFGQLSVRNTNYPKGRTDPFAAQVRMDKVNGKWLMSALTTVSSPVA
jgi:hypothetical protein